MASVEAMAGRIAPAGTRLPSSSARMRRSISICAATACSGGQQTALFPSRVQLPQLVAIDFEGKSILALELAGVEQRRSQHHRGGRGSAIRR